MSQPLAGEVLPQLTQELGESTAVELYTSCLATSAQLAADFRQSPSPSDANRKVVLLVDGDERDPAIAAAASIAGARVVAKNHQNRWRQLLDCMGAEFDRGARVAAVMHVDNVGLPLHILEHAFRALQFHAAVIGPCVDGSAYFVGLQRPLPPVLFDCEFEDVHIVETLLEKLGKLAHPYLLPFWYRLSSPEHARFARAHSAYLRMRSDDNNSAASALEPSSVEQISPPQ